MQTEKKDYQKYRWFFTSSGKLVIGGKSAEQNEEIMRNASSGDIILHTASPGSPFCVIENPSKKDIEEAAVFDACFSQEWKRGKKKATVHIFEGRDVLKIKGMKTGTFGVHGKIKKIEAELKLTLIVHEGKLRAVPIKSAGGEGMLILTPGKIEKDATADKILSLLSKKGIKVSKDEVMAAIPSGGFGILE